MFWYLAAMCGLRYYAALLHDHAWEDECVAPARAVAEQVRRMVDDGADRALGHDEL